MLYSVRLSGVKITFCEPREVPHGLVPQFLQMCPLQAGMARSVVLDVRRRLPALRRTAYVAVRQREPDGDCRAGRQGVLSPFVRLIRPSTIPTTARLAVFRRTKRPKSIWLPSTHGNSSFPDVQLHIVDAPLGAGPESILTIVVMDSGLIVIGRRFAPPVDDAPE